MEAIANFDFRAAADNQLSFRASQVLKILNTDNDWYRAELDGKEGLIPGTYVTIKNSRWYCGRITRAEAEQILINKNDGSFLIRKSESTPEDFALSVKCFGDVQHFKILRDTRGQFFLWVEKFDSLDKLIQHHHTYSISGYQDIVLHNESPRAEIVIYTV